MSNGRRQERHFIKGDVRMRQRGASRYPATIRDVSIGGCRVELAHQVSVGDTIWVGLPGIESIQATVRWADGWIAGVEFDRPLHPSVLEMVEQRIRDANR